MSWEMVDEGWGRRAVDFSTLSEPANCREYIAVHQRLGVGPGIRLLDMACGSGLAIELARIQGATCAGIDASPRLTSSTTGRTITRLTGGFCSVTTSQPSRGPARSSARSWQCNTVMPPACCGS